MGNLTPLSKFMLILLTLGILFGGGYYVKNKFFNNPSTTSETESKSDSSFGGIKSLFSGGEEMSIGVNTWGGFAPLAYLNGGSLEPNENSILYKEYGIKLHIKILDVFDDSRNAFKSDNVDVVYCTADALPVEMGAGSAMAQTESQIFAQVDWSRGGDLIVVTRGINTVTDLKKRTIAVAEGTASNTFLIKTLEANGMLMSDVILKKVTDGIEAAKLFKTGVVDAAVVWTPDDGDCLEAIKGSKVLVSTKVANYIIADGLVAKRAYIEKNKELLIKFTTAWLKANADINTNESISKQAAADFSKAFNVDLAFAENGIKNVRLTTYGDNLDFFGMNPTYTGVTGEQLYSKMSIMYSDLNLTSKPLAWRGISNTSIIEAINLTGAANDSEKKVDFTPVTETVKVKEAISSKKVTINFESGSSFLDDNDKSIIDREFGSTLKDFGNARVRIEGNSDATGSNAVNQPLSEKRAQTVAEYLIKEYRVDADKFIIIGNGSKKAIEDGVTGASEAYRKTDFQLVID